MYTSSRWCFVVGPEAVPRILCVLPDEYSGLEGGSGVGKVRGELRVGWSPAAGQRLEEGHTLAQAVGALLAVQGREAVPVLAVQW